MGVLPALENDQAGEGMFLHVKGPIRYPYSSFRLVAMRLHTSEYDRSRPTTNMGSRGAAGLPV
jgi:hypothetical protein